jgi:hypothetical protein
MAYERCYSVRRGRMQLFAQCAKSLRIYKGGPCCSFKLFEARRLESRLLLDWTRRKKKNGKRYAFRVDRTLDLVITSDTHYHCAIKAVLN